MFRYFIGIIFAFLAWTFMRAVMGVVQKAVITEVKSAMGEDTPAPEQQSQARPAAPTASTTLRKCVSCATYKPESSMIRYGSGEKSLFFCSAECEKQANG
jgi:hypothetical protein